MTRPRKNKMAVLLTTLYSSCLRDVFFNRARNAIAIDVPMIKINLEAQNSQVKIHKSGQLSCLQYINFASGNKISDFRSNHFLLNQKHCKAYYRYIHNANTCIFLMSTSNKEVTLYFATMETRDQRQWVRSRRSDGRTSSHRLYSWQISWLRGQILGRRQASAVGLS